MLDKTLVRKKIEKLRALYNRVKWRLPADFHWGATSRQPYGNLSGLEHNIEYIDFSIDMICDKKYALLWILYFNGAYKELLKYKK